MCGTQQEKIPEQLFTFKYMSNLSDLKLTRVAQDSLRCYMDLYAKFYWQTRHDQSSQGQTHRIFSAFLHMTNKSLYFLSMYNKFIKFQQLKGHNYIKSWHVNMLTFIGKCYNIRMSLFRQQFTLMLIQLFCILYYYKTIKYALFAILFVYCVWQSWYYIRIKTCSRKILEGSLMRVSSNVVW